MKKLLVYFLILPIPSIAQTGSVSGNAYFKYNNFIGNRADAGCAVYLYHDSINKPLEQQCDLQGNFKFDNLAPRSYMVFLKSKNNSDNWEHNYIELRYANLQHYCGVPSTYLNKSLYDSVDTYRSYYSDALVNSKGSYRKKEKLIQQGKEKYVACIRRVFAGVPNTDPFYFYGKCHWNTRKK